LRDIHREGHEIASHGYDHRLIYQMTPDQFREDSRKSKRILEDIIGEKVIGYRAPSYSMIKKSLWALAILSEEGYHYDSSIFPIHHDRYGIPDAPRFPFAISFNGNGKIEFSPFLTSEVNKRNLQPQVRITAARQCVLAPHSSNSNPQSIVEFPLSTVRFFNMNFPISGGGYFRLFPYRIIKKLLRRINREEKRPFIFYLHPWEIDSEQPRVTGVSNTSKFRHYINLDKTEKRLKKLLADFQFSSIREIIEQNPALAPTQPRIS